MEEKAPESDKPAKSTKKPRNLRALLFPVLFLVATFMIYSSVIHFTNLRHRIPIDPFASIAYQAKKLAANSNTEKAYFHISQSERLVSEVYEAVGSGNHDSSDMTPYESMIWHNEQATQYMLAAEVEGVNLRERGLIGRLCDSLEDQYLLITGQPDGSVPEESSLEYRVNAGEELETVFAQIQSQLQTAMNW